MSLQHDGLLWISTGRDRFDKSWKNRQLKWSELVAQLSRTIVTRETVAEYAEMTKDKQGAIKDVGGFVGGTINGGQRKKNSITSRTLITLDLDSAPPDFIDDLTLYYGNAFVLYSTHKHTADSPRFRLVMPLNREVYPDEYEAIGRRIAANLEMKYFDPTTFQPERLMYWPSTPKDGVYYYQAADGPWLDADKILAEYKDWGDMSQWPMHTGEKRTVDNKIKKQGDPLEKPGVIGAFCRVYSITSVIDKYLKDEYTPTDFDDRYTFTGGSTSGGLVVYEDKYAYSHHSTDPTGGVLCNSFDLVRLHRFKDLDKDVKEGTPGNKLPSFLAMSDFASEDHDVRFMVGKERLEKAREEFADEAGFTTEESSESGEDWLKLLNRDRKLNIRNTIENIMTIFKYDIRLKGAVALNLFTMREMVMQRLPFQDKFDGVRTMTDIDEASIRRYLESIYEITATSKIKDAVMISTYDNRFHPVRDYVSGLVWDGTERIDTLLIDYMGAEDSSYTRQITRKSLVAAIARIFNPGVKFDNITVLVGPQGVGKSTIISKLGRSWYSDSFGNLKTKEAAEQILGVWIMEIGELAGLKKAEVEEIKLFISKQVDSYRKAYGHFVNEYPRQCVFWGSTNNMDFLQDATGNRRFWPVTVDAEKAVKNIFRLTDTEVGQVWAEAKAAYSEGETLFLDKEIELLAQNVQKEHMEVDDRLDDIKEYLEILLPEDWADMNIYSRRNHIKGVQDEFTKPGVSRRVTVSAAEVWAELFEGDIKSMNRYNTKPIHNSLRHLGWEQKFKRSRIPGYGRQIVYSRIDLNDDDL